MPDRFFYINIESRNVGPQSGNTDTLPPDHLSIRLFIFVINLNFYDYYRHYYYFAIVDDIKHKWNIIHDALLIKKK